MNAAHLHLLLNHIPVLGTIVATLLLTSGILRHSRDLKRTAALGFVVLGVVGVLVYLTGEPAEEMVEGLAGVSESALEMHEEAALVSTVLLFAVGGLALGGLLAYRHTPAGLGSRFSWILLVAALAPAGSMAYTANLGGQIRHSELRSDGPAGAAQESDREGEEWRGAEPGDDE